MDRDIRITAKGAVCLGEAITCDGFVAGFPARVQTHVHSDHLHDFSTSKGHQQIFLTRASLDLLIARWNGDLPYRSNITSVKPGEPVELCNGTLLMLGSGHMLGSAQVAYSTRDGLRVGYSGDFSWPLQHVIKVDKLVVDATCGSPALCRSFSYADVMAELAVLLPARIKFGPVHIQARPGLVEDLVPCLQDLSYPLVCSRIFAAELDVYRRHGYLVPEVHVLGTPETRRLMLSERYLQLYGTGDPPAGDDVDGSRILLSARYCGGERPVTELSDGVYAVALSKHADFNQTIEYVRETGAQYVIADSTRSSHGQSLVEAIRRELGVEATCVCDKPTLEWGA